MMACGKEENDPGPEGIPRSPRQTAVTPDNGGENPDQLLGLYCSSLHRKCSNCGRTGHNSRTCLESRTSQPSGGAQALQSRDVAGPGNSTVSLDKDEEELSDDSGQKSKPREGRRKKGVAWTEEEHKKFLDGLKKLGKGNWRGISRHFVKSKTPTQVASHAQKYFLRQTVPGKRKRRSSLFDVVLESEQGREAAKSTAGTVKATGTGDTVKAEPTNGKASVTEPQVLGTPAMQSPEAMWAYWCQMMMMQHNHMAWMAPLMGPMPAKPQEGRDASQGLYPMMPGAMGPMPGLHPGMVFNGPAEGGSAGRPNPAMAAFMAQQNQAAALMAMNYMPQFSEYLGRCAAEAQIRATQAAQAQAATQNHPEGSSESMSGIGNTNSPGTEEDFPSRPSKLTIVSNSDSRLDLSHQSTQMEECGNGELVKPRAVKARSFMELPNWKLDQGSQPNSPSKQSQSTQVGGGTTFGRFSLVDNAQDMTAEA